MAAVMGSAIPFATTRWSVVIAARLRGSEGASDAVAALFRTYATPLYLYARRLGYDTPSAEDHTQEFIARLLERDGLRTAEPTRGRFRSFLLTSFKHFLSDQRDRDRAARRGGRTCVVSIDVRIAEGCWEPADPTTPEHLYERAWALALLDRVVARLRSEYDGANRAAWFDRLKDQITGHSASSYAELAAALHSTEGAIRVAVHRLRRRYRELLREEVARTLEDDKDVDDELRALMSALAAGT
jgi:RNA polymerase sigma-70 factor (ECF subfamily)